MKKYCKHIDFFEERDPFITEVNNLGKIVLDGFDLEGESINGKLKKLYENCKQKRVNSLSCVLVKTGKCDICFLIDSEEILVTCLYCKNKFCLQKGMEYSSCGYLNYTNDKKQLEPCCLWCQPFQ